jgi:hypothetical protein
MPEPLSSKSGLTRRATRAGSPSACEAAASTGSSRRDSTLTSTPAATAWRSSPSRLPGPAKLTSAGSAPASSATFSSPADATSMPSTSPAMNCTSAGIGLAFIA